MTSCRARRDERGAAIVDVSLVLPLLLLVFLLVLQLGLMLHVRNTLIVSAAEGARVGARVDAELADGVARTEDLISGALNEAYAANVTSQRATVGGVAVVEVTVQAPLPVLALFGPEASLTVTARAFEERQ